MMEGVPDFPRTTPFYLKLSIALLHIMSMCMVIYNGHPVSIMGMSQWTATKTSHTPGDPPQPARKATLTTTSTTSTTMTGSSPFKYATPPLPPPPGGRGGGGGGHKDREGEEDSTSSSDNWWIVFVNQTTGMRVVHHTVGGFIFSCLPLIIAGNTILASMFPRTVQLSKHQVWGPL